mgnify:CR=1 FL=1
MTIQESLFSRATSHSGLSDLIGTRFYPQGEVPDDPTTPFCAYQLVSTPPHNYQDHEGKPNRWRYRVQIDCYAKSRDDANSLGRQAFDCFEGWSTDDGDVGWSRVQNWFDGDRLELDLKRDIVEINVDHTV